MEGRPPTRGLTTAYRRRWPLVFLAAILPALFCRAAPDPKKISETSRQIKLFGDRLETERQQIMRGDNGTLEPKAYLRLFDQQRRAELVALLTTLRTPLETAKDGASPQAAEAISELLMQIEFTQQTADLVKDDQDIRSTLSSLSGALKPFPDQAAVIVAALPKDERDKKDETAKDDNTAGNKGKGDKDKRDDKSDSDDVAGNDPAGGKPQDSPIHRWRQTPEGKQALAMVRRGRGPLDLSKAHGAAGKAKRVGFDEKRDNYHGGPAGKGPLSGSLRPQAAARAPGSGGPFDIGNPQTLAQMGQVIKMNLGNKAFVFALELSGLFGAVYDEKSQAFVMNGVAKAADGERYDDKVRRLFADTLPKVPENANLPNFCHALGGAPQCLDNYLRLVENFKAHEKEISGLPLFQDVKPVDIDILWTENCPRVESSTCHPMVSLYKKGKPVPPELLAKMLDYFDNPDGRAVAQAREGKDAKAGAAKKASLLDLGRSFLGRARDLISGSSGQDGKPEPASLAAAVPLPGGAAKLPAAPSGKDARQARAAAAKPLAPRVWREGFTAEGTRNGHLQRQADLATAALRRDNSPQAKSLLARLKAARDPADRELALLEIKRHLDQSESVKGLQDLAAEGADEEEVAAFVQEHKDSLRAYSAFGMAHGEYVVWLRANLPKLPDGTAFHPEILNIHPAMLPGRAPGAPAYKSTRVVGGRSLPGIEYENEDGRGINFMTSLPTPGGGLAPVNLVYGEEGQLVRRHSFTLPPGGGKEPGVVTEEGTFDEQGRLVKGMAYAGAAREKDTPVEVVATEPTEDGNLLRARRIVKPGEKHPRERTLEVVTPAGRVKTRRVSQLSPENGAELSRREISFDSGGNPTDIDTVIFDPTTGKMAARDIWTLKDGRWTHYIKNAATEQSLRVGETEFADVDPEDPSKGRAPRLKGPGVYGIQAAGTDEVGSLRIDLGPLLPLSFQERRERLTEFVKGPLLKELRGHQPRVIATGFWGGESVARNPGALVSLMETAVDEAQSRGTKPILVLDLETDAYHLTIVDKENRVAARYRAEYSKEPDPKKQTFGTLSLYRVTSASGKEHHRLQRVIANENKHYIPLLKTQRRGTVTGRVMGEGESDWMIEGAYHDQKTDFVERNLAPGGRWQDGDTVPGQWETYHTMPSAGGVVWEAIPKAGETVVAGVGAGLSGIGWAGTSAALWVAPESAGLRRSNETFSKQAWADLQSNPLAMAWSTPEERAKKDAEQKRFYIMTAPEIMAEQAVASQSWYGKATWGGLSVFTSAGLQTGVGLASFGPLGGLGAGANAGRVANTANKVFSLAMDVMGAHGSVQGTLGEGGVIDSFHTMVKDGSPESEMAFYRSLHNVSADAIPFFTGAAAAHHQQRQAARQRVAESGERARARAERASVGEGEGGPARTAMRAAHEGSAPPHGPHSRDAAEANLEGAKQHLRRTLESEELNRPLARYMDKVQRYFNPDQPTEAHTIARILDALDNRGVEIGLPKNDFERAIVSEGTAAGYLKKDNRIVVNEKYAADAGSPEKLAPTLLHEIIHHMGWGENVAHRMEKSIAARTLGLRAQEEGYVSPVERIQRRMADPDSATLATPEDRLRNLVNDVRKGKMGEYLDANYGREDLQRHADDRFAPARAQIRSDRRIRAKLDGFLKQDQDGAGKLEFLSDADQRRFIELAREAAPGAVSEAGEVALTAKLARKLRDALDESIRTDEAAYRPQQQAAAPDSDDPWLAKHPEGRAAAPPPTADSGGPAPAHDAPRGRVRSGELDVPAQGTDIGAGLRAAAAENQSRGLPPVTQENYVNGFDLVSRKSEDRVASETLHHVLKKGKPKYVRSDQASAILIDPASDPALKSFLDDVAAQAARRFKELPPQKRVSAIAEYVGERVKERIKYNAAAAAAFDGEPAGGPPRLLRLGDHMDLPDGKGGRLGYGYGVCLHQNLLAHVTMEHLSAHGLFEGTIVSRAGYGHFYTLIEPRHGPTQVIDISQNRIKALEQGEIFQGAEGQAFRIVMESESIASSMTDGGEAWMRQNARKTAVAQAAEARAKERARALEGHIAALDAREREASSPSAPGGRAQKARVLAEIKRQRDLASRELHGLEEKAASALEKELGDDPARWEPGLRAAYEAELAQARARRSQDIDGMNASLGEGAPRPDQAATVGPVARLARVFSDGGAAIAQRWLGWGRSDAAPAASPRGPPHPAHPPDPRAASPQWPHPPQAGAGAQGTPLVATPASPTPRQAATSLGGGKGRPEALPLRYQSPIHILAGRSGFELRRLPDGSYALMHDNRSYPVTEGRPFRVGRDQGNDFVSVGDPQVSGQHFEVMVSGDRVLVRDLGSSNRTAVHHAGEAPAAAPAAARPAPGRGGQAPGYPDLPLFREKAAKIGRERLAMDVGDLYKGDDAESMRPGRLKGYHPELTLAEAEALLKEWDQGVRRCAESMRTEGFAEKALADPRGDGSALLDGIERLAREKGLPSELLKAAADHVDPVKASKQTEGYLKQSGSQWASWSPSGGSKKVVWGAKLHVSPRAGDAVKVMNIVLPYLRQAGIKHKVSMSLLDYCHSNVNKMLGGAQRGKFMAIYPDTPQIAAKVAADIDRLLIQNGLSAGPAPPYNIPLGQTGAVSYRYGKFSGDDGLPVMTFEINGVKVQDQREVVGQHREWNRAFGLDLPDLETMVPGPQAERPSVRPL